MRTLTPALTLAAALFVLTFPGCARQTDKPSDNLIKPQAAAVSPEAEVKPAPVEAPATAAPPAVLPAQTPAVTPEEAAAPASPAERLTKQTIEPTPVQAEVLPQPRIEPSAKSAEPEKAVATAPAAQTPPSKDEAAKGAKDTAKATGPRTVAVVGDSLAVGVGMTMQQRITDYEGIGCTAAGKVSTGLISKKLLDWDKKLAELVAAKKVTAVVVVMGGNDANNGIAGKMAGAPEWNEGYRQKAEEFLKIATRAGAKVLWVGLPAMREPAYAARVRAVNEAAKRACSAVPGCAYMEPSDIFTDAAGNYVQIKTVDGKKVTLRGKDGVHMTMTGYDLLCRQILERLDKTVGLKSR